ncbi:hypothetical protein [Streptomyces sp. 7N604]|uniref:hypothetical protein n=1 Tax=Streptomyces sp. 7N604 TaxID=3457415 RepID=UPI003FD67C72
MSARRPLLTATAAGSLLFALWFVPSANATVERRTADARSESPGSAAAPSEPQNGAKDLSKDLSLADTGSVDTTPYLVGGTLFLGFGAAMVAYAARRAGTSAL